MNPRGQVPGSWGDGGTGWWTWGKTVEMERRGWDRGGGANRMSCGWMRGEGMKEPGDTFPGSPLASLGGEGAGLSGLD